MSSLDCSRVLPVNVSNMPWQIVVSADSSRASLLLEVAVTQAGITCLVNQDGQYYMNLRVSRGPNDASLDLRFMGSSSQDSFDEKSFNGLEFLYKENPAFNLDDVEQRLRDHWIICLAERVVEVMLCTGFSDRCRASIEVYAESSDRIDMIRNVLSHIEPGYVGATAALLGGIVYNTPSSGDLDSLLDLTSHSGLRDMWMTGSLEHPCNEPILFKDARHVVISYLVSRKNSDKALEALPSGFCICFGGSSSWPLLWFTRSDWEVRATQRIICSAIDSPDLVKALLLSNNIVDSNHTNGMQETNHYIKYAITALNPLGDDSLNAVENVFSLARNVDKHEWLAALMAASITESLVVRLYGKDWRNSAKDLYGEDEDFVEADSHKEIACDSTKHLHGIMRSLGLSDDDGLRDLLEMTLDSAHRVCSFLDRFQVTGLNPFSVLDQIIRSSEKDVSKDVYALGITHSRRICYLILLMNEILIRLINEQVFLSAHEDPFVWDRGVWDDNSGVKIASAALDLMKMLDESDLL